VNVPLTQYLRTLSLWQVDSVASLHSEQAPLLHFGNAGSEQTSGTQLVPTQTLRVVSSAQVGIELLVHSTHSPLRQVVPVAHGAVVQTFALQYLREVVVGQVGALLDVHSTQVPLPTQYGLLEPQGLGIQLPS
jgi:hypothetical protein